MHVLQTEVTVAFAPYAAAERLNTRLIVAV